MYNITTTSNECIISKDNVSKYMIGYSQRHILHYEYESIQITITATLLLRTLFTKKANRCLIVALAT